MAFSKLRASYVCAGFAGFVLAVSCTASSQAQTVQQGYGFCVAMSSSSNTVYVSNVFSVPAASTVNARSAFTQYMQTRDKTASGGNCNIVQSQQQANTMKQNAESHLKQAGVGGKTVNLVETGWSYQGQATAATSATGAASSITGAATNSVTGAANAAGQSVQQTATQSVEGVQQTATQSVNSTITNGMSALQGKLFHKGGSGQNNAAQGQQPAATNTGAPANTTAAAPAANGTPVAQNVVATTAAPTKPTIQDEGDGKHSLLMTPGQKDAIELTLVEGSKNVYLDEATGDKYVVMPNGDITRVPHRAAAATATTSATK
jgi:hypothetical protein